MMDRVIHGSEDTDGENEKRGVQAQAAAAAQNTRNVGMSNPADTRGTNSSLQSMRENAVAQPPQTNTMSSKPRSLPAEDSLKLKRVRIGLQQRAAMAARA